MLTDREIRLACLGDGFYWAGEGNETACTRPPVLMPRFVNVAEAQLAKDMEWEDKRGFIKDAECQQKIDELLREIEDKADHTDLIDTIRINLDWLDWQAIRERFAKKLGDKNEKVEIEPY